jgi:glycosyltransferase involved in cell wall biosynthesis
VNVALLNPVYWPEVRRGSERFARELADGLLARGHSVRLITSHRGRPSTTVEDGLEVVRVWRPPIDGRLQRRMFEDHLAHIPFSSAALSSGNDDVAHALYATDALGALRWKDTTGKPVVFSYMGIPHRQSLANRRWRKEIVTRVCSGADAVVGLSQIAADGFRRWLGVEARVIPPPVDLGAFSPQPDVRADAPTILCAADHTQPRKRVGLLLEAFAQVRRERPDARLVLTRVRGAADPRGDGVEVRDLDDRAALASANREAWAAALPSVGEAFGLVLAEALACGTPVVGTQAEVVGGQDTGRVFDADDPGHLARLLLETLELAGDPATAAACRARAERWSVQACAEAYEQLYAEVGAGLSLRG